MIKKLRYLCTLLLIAVASAAWGEEVYKTLDFATASGESSNYTSTWTAIAADNTEYSMENFNRNTSNGQWSYVKCGRKNNASVATIVTSATIDKAITKVVVTIDAITESRVNSIKLYTSSDKSTWTEAGSFTKAVGAQELSLSSPNSDLYYKLEFDCASGTTNGLVTVSKVEYYYSPSDKCALPTFSPVAGTYTSAQNVTISTTTGDATIYYTTDGTDPTEGSASYSTPISVSSTTTIKAIAVKSGLANSSIATATYTIVSIENEGTEEDPYTVSDARNAIDAGTGVTDVYATGIVSAIPTVYDSEYKNITFNFVDAKGDADFLQAYRCTGTDAQNVRVGDIVVVKGNLTKFNSTYEFAQGCELVSLEHPQSPTITFTPEAINLGSSNPTGTEISKTFTVSQINLTANIALSISGQGAVSPTTIGKGAGDTEVTWTYTPTEVGDISATITATSEGAETQTLLISGSAVAPLIGDCYEKVTEAPQDWSGCYIITGTNSGDYYALTGVENNLGTTAAVTVVGVKIESNTTTDAYQVIVAHTENGYSLYMDGVGYLGYNSDATSSNNYLHALQSYEAKTCEWTIAYSSDGATFTNVRNTGRKLQFNYNSGNSRFACYTSNQVKPTLFKYTGTVVQNPSITAADVDIAYDATFGSITYTLENEVQGGTLTASVTSGNWLTLGTVGETIPFTCEANTAAARTATVTLTYTYGDNQTITKEVRVTQTANPNVSDYAELPFEWEGGAKAAFLALNGVTANSLGSDYAESYAPYLIKFDGTGDYIQVKTDSQPGKVTIGVKMIGGANTSTITVQESSDGETFSDVQELTISGAQNDVLTLETTTEFKEASRYVRLLFTKGSNIGVGPITITKRATEIVAVETVELDATATSGEFAYSILYPQTGTNLSATADVDWISDVTVASDKVTFTTTDYTGGERSGHITLTYGTITKVVTVTQAAAPQKYTLTIGTPENVTITATYNSDQVISNGGSAELENGTEVTFALTIPEGYALESLTVAGPEEGQTVTPTESATTAGVYTFNMPAFNVTINASVTKVETITYTLATSITPGKHYIITNGTDKAMGEQRTNNRGSGDISISDETAIVVSNAGVHEFVIDGNAADGYTIKEEGVGYLYAASTTKNWLMTQETNNDNGIWTISIDSESGVASIKAEKSENRNVMQYNVNSGNPIFSCYASASQSPVYLYEKDGEIVIPAVPTFSQAGTYDKVQNIVITCATEGATIYYTTDGSTPTTDSEQYTEAIAITATTTLKAIAVNDGQTSEVATANYPGIMFYQDYIRGKGYTQTINFANPLNWTDGITVESSDEGVVTITNIKVSSRIFDANAQEAGEAYITVSWNAKDNYEAGSVSCKFKVLSPDEKGQKDNPYTVEELKAYIESVGGISSYPVYVQSVIARIEPTNQDKSNFHLWISDDGNVENAIETINSSYANRESLEGTNGLFAGDEVKCVVYIPMSGMQFVVIGRKASAPVISVAGGEYTAEQSVEITCANEVATIYYTLDGTEPTKESTPYTSAITIGEGTTTLKAVAWLPEVIKDTNVDVAESYSEVASATYTIAVSTQKGDVNGDKKVDIADVTALVNIIVNSIEPTDAQIAAGNLNPDDGLTVNDVEALVQMILSNSNQ